MVASAAVRRKASHPSGTLLACLPFSAPDLGRVLPEIFAHFMQGRKHV